MARTPYQLMKNDEPIALGNMTHCLDVFYWEIYYGCDRLDYNIIPFKQDKENDTTHYIPHLTNININDNTEEPLKFIKRIAKERD